MNRPVSAPVFVPASWRSVHVPITGSVVVSTPAEAPVGLVAAANPDVVELSPWATMATSNAFSAAVDIAASVGSPMSALVAAPPVSYGLATFPRYVIVLPRATSPLVRVNV